MSAQITDGNRAAQLIAAGYRVWDEPCPRRLRVVFANQVGADRDVAWSYPAPRPEAAKVENLICFYGERVDRLLVDGVEEPAPRTG